MATLHIHQDIINAIKKEVLLAAYPVGSIYFSNKNTNPSSLFGGTWVAWGSGRVPVGVNSSDSNFNTVEKTGGAATHTHSQGATGSTILTINQIPNHQHDYGDRIMVWDSANASKSDAAEDGNWDSDLGYFAWNGKTSGAGGGQGHTHTNPNTNSSSLLQPYITCYMWKRTA